MMPISLRLACLTKLLLFCMTSGLAHAADTKDYEHTRCGEKPTVGELRNYPGVYNLYFENDLFAGTDNNYTNGVKLSWISANLQDYTSDPCLPLWIRRLNRLSRNLQPGAYESRNMVFSLGQEMYTPTDRTRTDLITNDRPYAGWLYLGMAYNARTEKEMDTVELDIGMVGPASLARQSQNFIHDLRGIDRFNGWDNQLKNELGIIYVREKKQRVLEMGESGGPKMDAITHYGYALGNVKTYLNAGVEFRIGSYLPNDFGTSPIRPASDSNAPLAGKSWRRLSEGGVHAFVSLDGRTMLRNIFLDGNTFADSHSVSKYYLVGDVAAGIAWQWRGGKITYAQYLRSKEFHGQVKPQSYGSITLSLEY
ncbi:lipid A deacylase LpxR family protein [uncultured Oxalicibacterium sp.]|uniref:lipid A deacylase LpxR family protein n=1 Tax=uncultured Oxalicibacterium sp. TaxID=1168540 RepID=UPI0025FF4EAC|nr:lipid A deacylase LpxR family protein [uncultured Oxalicibacterium sp.]